MTETVEDHEERFNNLMRLVATTDPYIADVIREQVADLLEAAMDAGRTAGQRSMRLL